MLEGPESHIPLPVFAYSFVDQWPFVTLFPVSGNTSMIQPGWLRYNLVLQQDSFLYYPAPPPSLISKENKLMSRWSLFILVAFRIPWVCLIQTHVYTGLCKHVLICIPGCFYVYDNTVALLYPLFSSFYRSSSRARTPCDFEILSLGHISLSSSILDSNGRSRLQTSQSQPKYWGFSF